MHCYKKNISQHSSNLPFKNAWIQYIAIYSQSLWSIDGVFLFLPPFVGGGVFDFSFIIGGGGGVLTGV